MSRFSDFGGSPFQSSARVDQSSSQSAYQGSSYGGSQQMASAAPVSSVQSAPLSAPIQSTSLSAPISSGMPVRAAAMPPATRPMRSQAVASQTMSAPQMSAPKVIASAPVRATAQSHASPNIAAARAVIAAPPSQTAQASAKPMVTNIAKSEPVKAAPVAEAPEAKPVRTASLQQPTSAKSDAAPTSTAVATEEASPEFRWPARGRIIQGFKAGKSEGISIAVPEGTAVKAAEGGTVAYAGSELKGYGNLVLIRHPNGFVSAYAHNGELMVKRGDTVKRGQQVAKSGQSGDVTSPQLQFQLRKGSSPVDPTQYLAGL